MEIPFKSDEQRKAVFANMHGSNKRSKVRKYGPSQNLDVLKHKGPPRKHDKAYNQKELRMGVKAELEHTRSSRVAKMIAKDHLNEIPNYYSLLNQLEKEEKAKHSDIETESVSCKMCKGKNLELTDESCNKCAEEVKKFKKQKRQHKKIKLLFKYSDHSINKKDLAERIENSKKVFNDFAEIMEKLQVKHGFEYDGKPGVIIAPSKPDYIGFRLKDEYAEKGPLVVSTLKRKGFENVHRSDQSSYGQGFWIGLPIQGNV